MSMRYFKSIDFYQNRPLFLQKNTKFSSAGAPLPDHQNNPNLQIFGCAPESNYVYVVALLISTSNFKSINF